MSFRDGLVNGATGFVLKMDVPSKTVWVQFQVDVCGQRLRNDIITRNRIPTDLVGKDATPIRPHEFKFNSGGKGSQGKCCFVNWRGIKKFLFHKN